MDSRRMPPFALGLLLALAPGCGGRAPTSAPPPTAVDARQALTTALDSWKAGRPPGPVEGADPCGPRRRLAVAVGEEAGRL